ncbi:MAG TPA: glycoside hydrolase family 15 protein [Solirubrobacterales bacterium]|nr:glycoside hydrolase family 15 protein [Solirubrobacterales bacterium]
MSSYPPLADYGLVGDRRSAALVSSTGSIDWCCLPRFDSGAVFGRLLDWERGGRFAVEAPGTATCEQRYVEGTMVLETRLRGEGGEVRLLDFLAPPEGRESSRIVRIVEGVAGSPALRVHFEPRFDYGQVKPWIRGAGEEGRLFAAIGGDDGLVLRSELGLEFDDRHTLSGDASLGEGERLRFELAYRRPVELDSLAGLEPLDPEAIDGCLERTVEWWREWGRCAKGEVVDAFPGAMRSALTLKALSFEPTGAIAAAATTSLPEVRQLSGERNWDYRYSWVRDSAMTVRSLAELGCEHDADAFRRFIERSAAGNAEDLQILFGVGGERRLAEQEVKGLEGWRGSAPVRVGNQAAGQLQLDAFGQIVDQSWRWHRRGNSPDRDYWIFIADLVDYVVEHWEDRDKGIWEWRGEPRHFVHSKALSWSAVDRGIKLGEDCEKQVPDAWREARERIRGDIESEGYDQHRGIFRMAFGYDDHDAALLRLPAAGFLAWDDERMVRTADALREALDLGDGLLRRYDADDGMPPEGAFLACSFWLATCLARQGREEAREVFERAEASANGLGLFSEEYDPEAERMLGNFPQALTHLAHIEAAVALSGAPPQDDAPPGG